MTKPNTIEGSATPATGDHRSATGMQALVNLFDQWQSIAPVMLSVDRKTTKIRTHEALQPRSESLIPFADMSRYQRESDEHKLQLGRALRGHSGSDLEPVLVAEVQGELWLVDGHHRMHAYTQANRPIPARIMAMSWDTAVALSRLVNTKGVKLRMHADEARDALWQFMSHITRNAKLPLPRGWVDYLATHFPNVARSTIGRMGKKLTRIHLGEIDPEDYVGGRWPTWKEFRSEGIWKDREALLEPDQILERKATRIAVAILRHRDKDERAFVHALGMLRDGFREEAKAALDPDTREHLSDLHETLNPTAPDY